MKKYIAFLIVLFFMIQYGFAGTNDSTTDRKLDTITNKTDALQKSLDAMKVELKILQSDSSKTECNCVPNAQGLVTGDGNWFLVLSPFYLLILVALIVAIRLRDFNFTEALTENEPPKKTIKNPEYTASGIAANTSIPNISLLFPPTIEVSNIQPSLMELKEIAASKDAAIAAVQISLNKANADTPVLNQAVVEAQKELDDANAATVKLMQDLSSAQTQLDTLKAAAAPDAAAIEIAKKSVEDVQKLVDENTTVTTAVSATKKLEEANRVVSENTNTIIKLTELLPKAKAEADDAKKNVEIAEVAANNNTAYSINTYRPSISRYIAFITSMITVILVVCMSSFFIYHYIKTGCPPEFGALTMVLIALGLGVTPYIINKISTAVTANKS